MVDTSFGCGTGRALTFPGEIFEHIFTSLVRVSLPDADSGGRVAQYVATYGSRTMSLMVKAIQPARYDVILARIIYCCTNGTKPPSPPPPPSAFTCIRLSPLDFLRERFLSAFRPRVLFFPRKTRKIAPSDGPICHSSRARPYNGINDLKHYQGIWRGSRIIYFDERAVLMSQ